MNSTDIEETATNIIKNQVLRNKDCLKAYIDENDRTPLWDGGIWVYNSEEKKTDNFENKIDVQIKGRQVTNFKNNNTYQMEVKYLKGYQKEIKGTLLLVVDFIDIDNYKIYYCNLLPVDLFEILNGVDENQKSISLPLKEINEDGALNFKNVCINFYKNSIKQANKKIIDESQFNKIEEINFEIFAKKTEYEEYMEAADVYTYAKLKDTHEEVVTVKGKWKTFKTIKKKIIVNNKCFYTEYSVMGKNANEISIGPITIDLDNSKIHLKFSGTPKERIKALDFVINVLKYEYIMFDDVKFELPFKDKEMIIKNIEIYTKQKEYYNKIINIFRFFNTEFDVDYDSLSDVDIKNLHLMMNLYDGIFPKDMKELQRYYININKYKFIFVIVFNGNKLYNFYSQEMIDNSICLLIRDDKKIKTTIYANLLPEEYLSVSNFNEKTIMNSLKGIELNDEVLDSINLLMLSFLSSYDKTSDNKYLKLSDRISQFICKNRNNDIDFINSRQIKYRKKELSFNDKRILKEISEKEEYKTNYPILCCIDILLKNDFDYFMHYKKIKKSDKEVFKDWPIYNLLNNK